VTSSRPADLTFSSYIVGKRHVTGAVGMSEVGHSRPDRPAASLANVSYAPIATKFRNAAE